MTITVADIIALAGADPKHLHHIAELAGRLKALDDERARILSQLAEAGISEAPNGIDLTPPLHLRTSPMPRRPLHVCSECGEEATVNVDGRWFCASDDPTEQ